MYGHVVAVVVVVVLSSFKDTEHGVVVDVVVVVLVYLKRDNNVKQIKYQLCGRHLHSQRVYFRCLKIRFTYKKGIVKV